VYNLLEVAEGLRDRDLALRWLTEHIDTATLAGKMLYAGDGKRVNLEPDSYGQIKRIISRSEMKVMRLSAS